MIDKNDKQAFLCYQNALYYSDGCETQEINNKLKEAEKLGGKVEPSSFVILNYNGSEDTRNCLKSIYDTVPKDAREIIVIDNGSQDGSVDWLRCEKGIRLIENTFNAGFPGGCNIGIKAANPLNDIFLLNNDTIMCENALFWLRMALYSDNKNGVAGCVANHAVNHQRVIDDNKQVEEYIEFARNNNVPCENALEYKHFLMGFAMLIKREVIEKVGMLDENFFPGNFEDDDYGLRVLDAGYQNVVVHNSFIIHLGSKSFSKTSVSETLIRNGIRFKRKYGLSNISEFEMHSDFKGTYLEKYIDKISIKAKVLVVNCGVGANLTHEKWLYPQHEFYGIEKTDRGLIQSKNIKNINLELYSDIENIPFINDKFDLVFLDTSTIKKGEFEKYINTLKKILSQEGKILLLAKNNRHYRNWLPIVLNGEISYSDEIITQKDIEDYVEKNPMHISSAIFYFEKPQAKLEKRIVELIKSELEEKDANALEIRDILFAIETV